MGESLSLSQCCFLPVWVFVLPVWVFVLLVRAVCLKSLVLQSNYRVLTLFVKVPLKSCY